MAKGESVAPELSGLPSLRESEDDRRVEDPGIAFEYARLDDNARDEIEVFREEYEEIISQNVDDNQVAVQATIDELDRLRIEVEGTIDRYKQARNDILKMDYQQPQDGIDNEGLKLSRSELLRRAIKSKRIADAHSSWTTARHLNDLIKNIDIVIDNLKRKLQDPLSSAAKQEEKKGDDANDDAGKSREPKSETSPSLDQTTPISEENQRLPESKQAESEEKVKEKREEKVELFVPQEVKVIENGKEREMRPDELHWLNAEDTVACLEDNAELQKDKHYVLVSSVRLENDLIVRSGDDRGASKKVESLDNDVDVDEDVREKNLGKIKSVKIYDTQASRGQTNEKLRLINHVVTVITDRGTYRFAYSKSQDDYLSDIDDIIEQAVADQRRLEEEATRAEAERLQNTERSPLRERLETLCEQLSLLCKRSELVVKANQDGTLDESALKDVAVEIERQQIRKRLSQLQPEDPQYEYYQKAMDRLGKIKVNGHEYADYQEALKAEIVVVAKAIEAEELSKLLKRKESTLNIEDTNILSARESLRKQLAYAQSILVEYQALEIFDQAQQSMNKSTYKLKSDVNYHLDDLAKSGISRATIQQVLQESNGTLKIDMGQTSGQASSAIEDDKRLLIEWIKNNHKEWIISEELSLNERLRQVNDEIDACTKKSQDILAKSAIRERDKGELKQLDARVSKLIEQRDDLLKEIDKQEKDSLSLMLIRQILRLQSRSRIKDEEDAKNTELGIQYDVGNNEFYAYDVSRLNPDEIKHLLRSLHLDGDGKAIDSGKQIGKSFNLIDTIIPTVEEIIKISRRKADSGVQIGRKVNDIRDYSIAEVIVGDAYYGVSGNQAIYSHHLENKKMQYSLRDLLWTKSHIKKALEARVSVDIADDIQAQQRAEIDAQIEELTSIENWQNNPDGIDQYQRLSAQRDRLQFTTFERYERLHDQLVQVEAQKKAFDDHYDKELSRLRAERENLRRTIDAALNSLNEKYGQPKSASEAGELSTAYGQELLRYQQQLEKNLEEINRILQRKKEVDDRYAREQKVEVTQYSEVELDEVEFEYLQCEIKVDGILHQLLVEMDNELALLYQSSEYQSADGQEREKQEELIKDKYHQKRNQAVKEVWAKVDENPAKFAKASERVRQLIAKYDISTLIACHYRLGDEQARQIKPYESEIKKANEYLKRQRFMVKSVDATWKMVAYGLLTNRNMSLSAGTLFMDEYFGRADSDSKGVYSGVCNPEIMGINDAFTQLFGSGKFNAETQTFDKAGEYGQKDLQEVVAMCAQELRNPLSKYWAGNSETSQTDGLLKLVERTLKIYCATKGRDTIGRESKEVLEHFQQLVLIKIARDDLMRKYAVEAYGTWFTALKNKQWDAATDSGLIMAMLYGLVRGKNGKFRTMMEYVDVDKLLEKIKGQIDKYFPEEDRQKTEEFERLQQWIYVKELDMREAAKNGDRVHQSELEEEIKKLRKQSGGLGKRYSQLSSLDLLRSRIEHHRLWQEAMYPYGTIQEQLQYRQKLEQQHRENQQKFRVDLERAKRQEQWERIQGPGIMNALKRLWFGKPEQPPVQEQAFKYVMSKDEFLDFIRRAIPYASESQIQRGLANAIERGDVTDSGTDREAYATYISSQQHKQELLREERSREMEMGKFRLGEKTDYTYRVESFLDDVPTVDSFLNESPETRAAAADWRDAHKAWGEINDICSSEVSDLFHNGEINSEKLVETINKINTNFSRVASIALDDRYAYTREMMVSAYCNWIERVLHEVGEGKDQRPRRLIINGKVTIEAQTYVNNFNTVVDIIRGALGAPGSESRNKAIYNERIHVVLDNNVKYYMAPEQDLDEYDIYGNEAYGFRKWIFDHGGMSQYRHIVAGKLDGYVDAHGTKFCNWNERLGIMEPIPGVPFPPGIMDVLRAPLTKSDG